MKRYSLNIIVTMIAVLLISSCSDKKETTEIDDKEMITEKIMYDVQVVNDLLPIRTRESPDWFWENLPEPGGDEFVLDFVEQVLEGKLQAYYYDPVGDYENFEPIPLREQKEFLKNEMKMEVEYLDESMDEPEIKVAKIQFGPENVNKIRFLEEWYMVDGVFHKEVIAIAPYFTVIYPGRNIPYSTVFFWVFVNENKRPV